MSLSDDIHLLAQLPLFKDMNDDQLRLIAFGADRRVIAAGQMLFRQGSPAESAYVITSGSLELSVTGSDGMARTEAIAGAGALISGLLFSRIFTTRRVRWITPATIAMSSSLAVGLVASTSWLPSAVILLLFSLSVSTTIVTGITYRQLAAPDDLRSSVNVFGRMISWGGQPFGAAAGALISALLDVRAAYMFTVIVTAVSALMAYVFLRPGTEIATTTRSS